MEKVTNYSGEYSLENELRATPAMYENSHVLEKMLEELTKQNHELVEENSKLTHELKQNFINSSNEKSSEEDSPNQDSPNQKSKELVVNNWTECNIETVKKWQRDVEHTSFIYGEVLLGVKKKLKFFMISVLVLNAICALFAALSVTLTFLDQKWVGVIFEILILVSSALAFILSGLIPIFSLEEKLEDFVRYTEKLDNFWFVFEIELGISPDQRINAHDFIKRADGQYLSLMQQCPFIDVEEYQKANFSYKERLFQNSAWGKNMIKNTNQ